MSELAPRGPWCVFGNLVNRLMLARPAEAHTRPLVNASPRKLWLARPGDFLVLHVQPPPAFADYVFDLLGMNSDSVGLMVDTGSAWPRVSRDHDALG